jgi:hypothetical protein
MPVTHAFDALLVMTEHRFLPPWFWGNAGGRPVLSAREAAHVFSNALGAGLAALHEAEAATVASGASADTQTIVTTLRNGFGRGINQALATWPETFRKPSSFLRAALTETAATLTNA